MNWISFACGFVAGIVALVAAVILYIKMNNVGVQ